MKAIIDRTCSLYTGYHQPDHASLVDGQRQALLITGAGAYENNAELAFTAFGRMQNPHKTINAGELFIRGGKTPDDLDDTVEKKAREFSHKIVSKT